MKIISIEEVKAIEYITLFGEKFGIYKKNVTGLYNVAHCQTGYNFVGGTTSVENAIMKANETAGIIGKQRFLKRIKDTPKLKER